MWLPCTLSNLPLVQFRPPSSVEVHQQSHPNAQAKEEPYLTDELWRRILAFLPPEDLLQSTSFVSRRLAGLILEDSFWRHDVASSADLLTQQPCQNARGKRDWWVIPGPPPLTSPGQTNSGATLQLSKHQLQRYALYRHVTRRPPATAKEDARIQWPNRRQKLLALDYGSLLTPQKQARLVLAQQRTTCLASTTDRPKEDILNVLPSFTSSTWHLYGSPHASFLQPATRWWSSRPTPTPDARSETILLATHAPVCLLTRVDLQALLDPYVGHVVYSWKHTKISAYWLPHDPDRLNHGYPCTFAIPSQSHPNNQQERQDLIDHLLEGSTPVFTQSWPVEQPISDRADLLQYDLPGVVANVVAIELIGKRVEQLENAGYYACVQRLDCQGLPLYQEPADAYRGAPATSWIPYTAWHGSPVRNI